jgi:redox-sensitive bicupin YhaK (pirin superfamily)
MISIRRADERGLAHFGWLHSRHTFSFGNYFDPRHMGFGPLRVINEDRVEPGRGFGEHGHRDMEIISYVLEGALQHRDSMGNGSVIRPGDIQRMTAGTGVRHSEMNHSATESVHFLQIWIEPEREGIEPGYEQKAFSEADKRGVLKLVGSRDGRDGSVTINRDVDLYASLLQSGDSVRHALATQRHVWLQVVRGELDVEGISVSAGDGVALVAPREVAITAASAAELLLFDMAR